MGLTNVWGDNSTNVYVVGYKQKSDNSEQIGTVFHYDGSIWSQLNIPKKHGVFVSAYTKDAKTLYIQGIARDSLTGALYANAVWMYDGNEIKEIYSSTSHSSILSYMNGEIYCTIQNKIYKISNSEMKLWKDFASEGYLGMVEGRNEKDFFGRGYEGLKHYNGSNLTLVYPTNATIYDIHVFEKEVFLLARTDDYKMLVIHGKLE